MLYEFKGAIKVANFDQFALTSSNILLRGSKLKKSSWIYGIVVYTGKKHNERP